MHDDEKKLADVHPYSVFRVKNGKEIKNIKQLLKVLNSISHTSFSHHVNDEKNDFANWIRNSVGDEELAEMLEKTTDFKTTKEILSNRIELLEKKIEVRKIKASLEDLHNEEEMGIDKETEEVKSPEEISNAINEQEHKQITPDEPDFSPKGSHMIESKVEEKKELEMHPFANIKRGLSVTIRDIMIGVFIGLIIGYILGGILLA